MSMVVVVTQSTTKKILSIQWFRLFLVISGVISAMGQIQGHGLYRLCEIRTLDEGTSKAEEGPAGVVMANEAFVGIVFAVEPVEQNGLCNSSESL
jgi:hypothetical protein